MRRFVPLKIPLRRVSVKHEASTISKPRPDYGPTDVQRSSLMNGIKVAALKPTGALMCSCTIMYQAGSRYEQNESLGASHFLRIASSSSSCSFSKFAKARVLSQYGAAITCTSDRQTIAYTLRCPVYSFSSLKNYLLDTAARGCYNEWDIDELKPIIREDDHRIAPEHRVMDLVQRACWGGPLANSMFCEPERIDSMTGEILRNYCSQNMLSNTCSVTSVGVPFDETLKIAEMIQPRRELPLPRPQKQSFPRRGFEEYDLGANSTTWIAMVVPGCGTKDLDCLLKYAIIAEACGTSNMQRGSHYMDRVPQSPLGILAGQDVYTDYKTFNISYSETGVFGIMAKTRACSAHNVGMTAARFLKNIYCLNVDQINIGKERLKLSLALNDEDCVTMSEGVALQLANDLQLDSSSKAMDMVDSISPDEILCVAQILSTKCCDMAVAVVGDVSLVPHDIELLCG